MSRLLRRLGMPATVALSVAVAAELWGLRAFRGLVRRDVQTLLREASRGETSVVTEEMLRGLPEPVQRYLRYTGVVGKPSVRSVRLRQQGRFRLAAGKPWMPLDAQEWSSVRPPGFVWEGTVRMGPVPIVRAQDAYHAGEGHMLVKAASLFTVADATGEEMDRGSMVRYLNEMMWFPSAFLEDNISFEAVDATSADVTLTDHGRTATATMFFDSEGRLTNFVARRHFLVDGRFDLETWSTPITSYGMFEGLRLPDKGKAVWNLADGDFEYIDVTIRELDYGA